MGPGLRNIARSMRPVATVLTIGALFLLFGSVWAGEKKPFSHKIPAEGQTAMAELIEMWAPDSFWAEYSGEIDADCPVLLGDYFPFPNPISVPVITVTVFECGNLRLEALGEDGRTLDSFHFERVEQGAYIFKVETKVWQRENARFRVCCEGGGEVEFLVPRTVVLGIK